jgi:branched-chain amino acid transport system ATP-binding protein
VVSALAVQAKAGGQVTGPLLKLEKLEVVYHRVITAVQGISLEVPTGSIVALLGTNGAGKTTTLRAISGFIGLDDARVTEGSIAYRGERIENRPPHQVTARGITLVPERSKVFENLTVAENIEAVVPRPGENARKHAEAVWEYFPALARLRAREAGYLSGGERQMLAIGSALACAPELLLVDELSQGLAPLIVEELLHRLQAIRKDLGMTLLLVEQNAAVALDVADYAYVLENGRIVLDGTPEKLRQHQDIKEFYLGTGSGARKSYRDVKQYRRSRRWYG